MGLFGPSKPAIEKKYKFGKVLGTGNFATVKLAVRKNDNMEVAVKVIDKSKVDDMNDITVRSHDVRHLRRRACAVVRVMRMHLHTCN